MTNGKTYYTFKFTHSEETFTALAHMQYDLFCRRNYLARTVLAAVVILIGARNLNQWYSFLLIAYGGYLLTGKYISANHTARKLVKALQQANLPFPSSKYIFEEERMRVISQPDGEELPSLLYSSVKKLGMDRQYFYLFRDENGGYMIPRDKLGEGEDRFREFIEQKTGKSFLTARTSPLKRLSEWNKQRKKNKEPDHL